MGGRGPAQVVAPLQAESVGVELDQRRDHVVEGQDALGSRLRAKQTFACARAVVGAQPSGRLMGLRLPPALLPPARRFGVPRPFNEAGLTCRDAVERSALIV